jgi:hypothetical protein
MAWNRIIMSLHLQQECYANVAGCSWMLLQLARCVNGLNSINFDRTGEKTSIDATKLRESERKIMMLCISKVIRCSMDSKDRFNMGYIMGAVQEVFIRAQHTRHADMLGYENKVRSKGMKIVDRATHFGRVSTHKDQSDTRDEGNKILTMTDSVTVDELHAAFMDVEHDIMNHSPDLQVINLMTSQSDQPKHKHMAEDHHEQQTVRHATEKELIREKDEALMKKMRAMDADHRAEMLAKVSSHVGLFKAQGGVSQVLTINAYDYMVELFSKEVAYTLDASSQRKSYELSEKLRDAQSEISFLRSAWKKTVMAGVRTAQVKGQTSNDPTNALAVENAKNVAPHVSRLSPAIPSDLQVLHRDWKQRANPYSFAEPTSAYSPRARGLDPTDMRVPRSVWSDGVQEQIEAPNEGGKTLKAELERLRAETSNAWLSDRLERGFGMEAETAQSDVPDLPPSASELATAATTAPLLHNHPNSQAAQRAFIVENKCRINNDGARDIAHDTYAPLEAVLFLFDAPYAKIHPGVFKAMLLSGLRSAGVPETSVTQLNVQLQQDNSQGEDKLAAHVQGPVEHMAVLRTTNVSRLKVMGYPCKDVHNAPLVASKKPGNVVVTHDTAGGEDSLMATLEAHQRSMGAAPLMDEESAHYKEILDALKNSRYPHASKELHKLRDPASKLTADQLERLHRIRDIVRDSHSIIGMHSTWNQDVSPGFNTRLSCKVEDNYLRSFMSCDFEGVDVVKAVAALLEVDLHGAFNKEIVSAKPLAEPDASDQLWHCQYSWGDIGSKTDNIVQVSFADCLDELGSFFVCLYTPTVDSLTELRGVSLPPPATGMTRACGSLLAYKLTPNAQSTGFNLNCVSMSKPHRVAYNFLWMMPPWGLLRIYKGSVQDFPTHFINHVKNSQLLPQRLQGTAGRAQLYEGVRQRLKAPRRSVAETALETSTVKPQSANGESLPQQPAGKKSPAWVWT